MEDPILNYAWEARNAEEHDALGSADPKAGSFKINALDRSKPLYIENFQVRGGIVRDLKMDNGVACVEEGRLEMKPVTANGGKKIVEPPLGKNPQEICTYAMKFLAEYYREVF